MPRNKPKPVNALRKIWNGMWARCTNEQTARYARYGGRGIRVCKRWQTFELFKKDVGPRPSAQHSLGRIHNDRDYKPSNVRWETARQQQANMSTNVNVTWRGQTKCVSEWARLANLSPSTLTHRINAGWSIAKALNSTARPRTKYKFQEKHMTLAEWAKHLGVTRMYLVRRRDQGLRGEALFNTADFRPLKAATITYEGKTGTIADWVKWTGMSNKCIRSRWEKGWRPADILKVTRYYTHNTPSRRPLAPK